MTEHTSNRDFVAALKADFTQAVSLYFAPVRAVLGEFKKAVAANNEDRKLSRHGPKAA